MPKITVPINSFQFGELSPSLTSRTDTQVYQSGAKKVRNLRVVNQGGVKKRPGTERIYEFSNTVNTSNALEMRAEPFVFSDDEQYIFVFSNEKLDIFFINPTTGAVSLSTSLTGSTNCPWTTAKLQALTMASTADSTIICHETFMPKVIKRTALNTFTSSTFTFDNNGVDDSPLQPYYKFDTTGITLTPGAVSGNNVLITASASYFQSAHVGAYLLIGETPCEINSVISATQVRVKITGSIKRTLLPDSVEVFAGVNKARVTLVNHGLSSGASITMARVGTLGGISAANLQGSRTVSSVIDQNTFEYTAGASATASAIGGGSATVASTAATREFFEQSYSTVRGFPSAVVFHEGRLFFGGTTSQPNHIWGSKSGFFFNFDVGSGADNDSIDLNSNFGEFSHIRHLVSNRDLQVFSVSAESFIPSFQDRPITPSNARLKKQTPFGSSIVKPQPFDGDTLYVQVSGKMLGSYIYSEREQAYNTSNVSITAEHLMLDPTDIASIKGGFNGQESYCFLVNPDGTMSVFYSARAEERAGWMLWSTRANQKFHSVTVVDRRVFCISIRDEGDGTNRYYLEEFLETMPMDFCDEFSGSAGVFDVSSHFANGAVVKVVSGTDFIGEFTVAGGNVDVSSVKEITSAFIGFAFDVTLETMPIDRLTNAGNLTGKPRKIDMVTLDLLETLSVSVNSKDLIIRTVLDDFSLDRTKFTGKKEFRLVGFSKDPTVVISQSVPFDMQVNGMVIEVSF